MPITLPPELEAKLQQVANRQGKDLSTIVTELLTQSLAQEPNLPNAQSAKFMRFAGIAAEDASLLEALEEDVLGDRSSDLQRQPDL
jgi:predicted transcriptional regulator